MLYTSYLSNLKNLPKDSVKILITKWKGKIDTNKYNLLWRPQLSPDDLYDYKKNLISKETLFANLNKKLESNASQKVINEINQYLKANKDVFLICYCKEANNCHRSVVASYIANKEKITWEEFEEDK